MADGPDLFEGGTPPVKVDPVTAVLASRAVAMASEDNDDCRELLDMLGLLPLLQEVRGGA